MSVIGGTTDTDHLSPLTPNVDSRGFPRLSIFCMTIFEEAVILVVLFSETQRFWKDTPDFKVFSSFYQALNR